MTAPADPAAAPEQSRSFTTGTGAHLAYRLRRASDGAASGARRAVVLLHGMASNSTRWTEFAQETLLTEQWDVLRIDLRGHGDSSFRGRVGLSVWCHDLAAVLAQEGIAQVVLVGHCLGANLALHFAWHHPNEVVALVLIEPMLGPSLRGTLAWAARLRPVLTAAVPLLLALAACGLHRRSLRPLDLAQLDGAARETLAATGKFPEARFASVREDLKSFPLVIYLQDLLAVTAPLPPLSEIVAPTLVLLAGGSGFSTLEHTRRQLAAMPQGEVTVLDAQHWIPTERPVAMRLAIERWCARHTPDNPA
ncbi:hypothetical protein BURK2_03578 [Burkholderiales bacterium]|nr:MAG: alpha/beta hydrolase [Burkholderiales bacterium]CAG1007283.1 hypothetical protein BURK2_03578 [Burkholderiales bacterium]